MPNNWTNQSRAQLAKRALDHYVMHLSRESGQQFDEIEDFEDNVVDLITNLLHLAEPRVLDVQDILDRAAMHFGAEMIEAEAAREN